MMTMIWNVGVSMQGASNATTRQATTQDPNPATKQELQAAAREFRDAIRGNVQARLNAARIQQGVAGGVAGRVQGAEPAIAQTPPAPPTPPTLPREFTIRGPNGEQTIIGMPPPGEIIPPQAVDISIAFFITIAAIIIGLPLARAFGRRMDRRGTAEIPNEVASQLAHLNQAVDAIALEVERISEGQRFTTRLLSEQKESVRQTLPTGTGR